MIDEPGLRALWEKTLPPGQTLSTIPPDATLRPPTDQQPSTATAQTPTAPKSAADYAVLGELGRGGMGVVYRARQRSLEREVAVKRMRPDLARNAEARQLFLAEAMVTGALDHPNIVPVHALAVDLAGEVSLSMKLVGGASWKSLLHPETESERARSARFDLAAHLDILKHVGNAVAFAHARGVVHRDLKPENVMVGDFGEVLVMDWGLAVDVESKPHGSTWAPHRSTVRAPAGTPCYMAPELAEGRGDDVGPWTDVYLLGAILHEILTGRAPHQGSSPWMVILEAAASKPPEFGADVAPELAALCRRAMAKEPKDRPQDVAAFQAELADYSAHKESRTLERRAAAILDSGAALDYAQLTDVIAAFEQATVLWSGNDTARSGALRARMRYAEIAYRAGDCGLALSQLERVPGEESARLAIEVRAFQERRAALERTRRRLRAIVAASLVAIVVVLGLGLWLVDRERARADENADRATARKIEVERLSDIKRLRALEAEALELVPVGPAKLAAMDAWLVRAEELAKRLDLHQATRRELEARALPISAERAQAAEAALRAVRAEYDAKIARIDEEIAIEQQTIEGGADETEIAARIESLRLFAADLAKARDAALRGAKGTGLTFASTDDQWQHEVLSELIERMERFAGDSKGAMAIVRRDRVVAATLEARSTIEHAARWSATIAAIAAAPAFAGLRLQPIVGLVPLGKDPDSGFEEFLHLPSHLGPAPERSVDGRIQVTADTGIILVLLPGGAAFIGAQSASDQYPNYDPNVTAADHFVQEIELDPYFIGKYEVSQAQWQRLADDNPSLLGPRYDEIEGFEWSPLLPVENVASWREARAVLRHWDLDFPTEAQWEVAARGGTTTPWWTGPDLMSLAGRENILDAAAKRQAGKVWKTLEFREELDDGATVAWPIDRGGANRFGLKNVCGNVNEWCLDPLGSPFRPMMKGTGERAAEPNGMRVYRGGFYKSSLRGSRIAARNGFDESSRLNIGVRPSRRVAP